MVVTESHRELSALVMNQDAYGFVGLPQRTLGIGPLKAERMADPEMCGIKEAEVVALSESGLEVVERRKLREGRGRETAGVIQAAGLGKREADNLNLILALIAGVGVLAEFLPLYERQAQFHLEAITMEVARKIEAHSRPCLMLVQTPNRQKVVTYEQPCRHSWQSATEDYHKLYSQDGRWAGGFILWTLEIYGEWRKRLKLRQGHWDANTGVFYYSGPKEV